MKNRVEFDQWNSLDPSSQTEVVLTSLDHINGIPHATLNDYLEDTVEMDQDSGLIYSKIGSPNDSREAVIAISSPYANGLEPHRLALSALHYEVARRGGFRDTEGNILPVVTIGSPTIKNRLAIDSSDKQNMVESLATRELELLERKKFGRIALFGFSQGADVSMVAARDAQDVEIAHVSVGDPVRLRDRNRFELLQDMTKVSIPEVKEQMKDGGLEFQFESYDKNGKIGNFLLSSAMPTNIIYMTNALGREEVANDALEIAKVASISIGYGSESAISQRQDVANARQIIEAAFQADEMNPINIVRMEGKNHAWGDNASALASFYFDRTPKTI